MGRKTTILFYFYIGVGVLALILTWVHAQAYFEYGLLSGNVKFWQDVLFDSNPANKFLTVDIFFFVLAANVWMVIESRRIGIKYVWGYIAVGVFIAISFAFPLFLAARERQLLANSKEGKEFNLYQIDIVGITILCLVVLSTAVWFLLAMER